MSKYYVSTDGEQLNLQPSLPVLINTSTDINAVRAHAQRPVNLSVAKSLNHAKFIDEVVLRINSEAKFKLPDGVNAATLSAYVQTAIEAIFGFLTNERRVNSVITVAGMLPEGVANPNAVTWGPTGLVARRKSLELILGHFPLPPGLIAHLRWVLTPHLLSDAPESVMASIMSDGPGYTYANTDDVDDVRSRMEASAYLTPLLSASNRVIAQVLTRVGIWSAPDFSPLGDATFDADWLDVWSNMGADDVVGSDDDHPKVADHGEVIHYLASQKVISARALLAFPVNVAGNWENALYVPHDDGLGSLLASGAYSDHDDVDELGVYGAYGLMDQDALSGLPNTTVKLNLVEFGMTEIERATYAARQALYA